MIERFLNYYAEPYRSPHNGYFLVDTDGKGFLNYLYCAYDLYRSDIEKIIMDHKTRVEAALIEHHSDPIIWAKYAWVAAYHDFFCKTWLVNLETR